MVYKKGYDKGYSWTADDVGRVRSGRVLGFGASLPQSWECAIFLGHGSVHQANSSLNSFGYHFYGGSMT